MSLPIDHENISKENMHPEQKSDTIERFNLIYEIIIIFNLINLISRDLPLDKLLKLSKSFKTDVDKNLNKFKVTVNKDKLHNTKPY